ncbi:MAG: hypothetical protein EOO90_07330 [Pedobacter sp.]|nr:MAG: hypothetical protein EOO90_07330 [Pedobacter sp.]
MKLDRIIWGVLLLFIGGVLLLDNFNVIEFYWQNVWNFWPVFLIILGINILFNRNNSQTGNIISLGILIITLSFLFVKGQEQPERGVWWDRNHLNIDIDGEKWNDRGSYNKTSWSQPFTAEDAQKKAILNITGGASTYNLKEETDSFIVANVSERKRGLGYILEKESTDSVNTLNFKIKGKTNGIKLGKNGTKIDFGLNVQPVWDMNVVMGAGKVDFDLKNYKVRRFNIDGGAADIDVKFGDLLAITDVNVKVGMADIKIEVPEGVGCRVITRTGFSSKDFDGFTKLKDGTYESPNYEGSAKKIFINLDGGFSNFEVKRY